MKTCKEPEENEIKIKYHITWKNDYANYDDSEYINIKINSKE